ncbi:hypothetical protein [Roseococcus sp.]|uniref:hypothetical protein n=1 Tax=Roseococcus sp. TaxID=2109646 RepID=UPI003BAB7F34
MTQDFVGRVERLPLPASEANSLMPLYEAVSNGLHAIEDRLETDAHRLGAVEVLVLREEEGKENSPISGFRVIDNGIGLNAANFDSFMRPDSRHKQRRGGKGVGRLGWLKVFDGIRVDSTFEDGAVLSHRSFDFRLSEENQVEEHAGRKGPPAQPGTMVNLIDFRPAFLGRCPVKPETIRQRLIAHFLPMVVSPKGVPIRVTDGQETFSLSDTYAALVRGAKQTTVTVQLDGLDHTFDVQHIRVSKAMRPEKGFNRLFLCANGRTVEQHLVDGSLGLDLLRSEDVYVGCVSGELLDQHVNAERTGFTLDADLLKELRKLLVASVAEFLEEFVSEMRTAKRGTARALVREYPQFLFIHEEMDNFVTGLKASTQSREDVYIEMARQRYRRNGQVAGLQKQLARQGEVNIREISDRYNRMVTLDQKGMLAEYVVRRKAVLDLLEKLREYADEDTLRDHREDALHRLVCPMRTDNSHLAYEDHNLWLLDDRLAFFAYFNSDKELRSFTDSQSAERPDIAFFYDTVSSWMGEGEASNTVVLVEFKRPGRDNYNGNDNPIRQLTDYVERLRDSSNLRNHKGRMKPIRLKDAAFHCYVVADLTDTLLKEMRPFSMRQTPDGLGRFGYIGEAGKEFFVEIVPYEKLWQDARQRSAVFFDKLGITDLDPSAAPDPMVEASLGAREPREGLVADEFEAT